MTPRFPGITAAVLVSLGLITLCGCNENKVIGAPGAGVAAVSLTNFPFPGGVGQSPQTNGWQGFAIDPAGSVYISSNNLLEGYDSQWHLLWSNTNVLAGLPSTATHLGDIDYSGGYIYGPVEGYNGCNSYTPVLLAVFDPKTGKALTWSDITADGHEASSVAIDPAQNRVIVSDFCQNDGTTTLWFYDLNALTFNAPGGTLSYTGKLKLSTRVTFIQGISWNADANQFLISADNSGPAGSLWFASQSGDVTGPVYIVPSSATAELEGVDYNTGYLTYFENGFVYGIGKPTAQPALSLASGTLCGPQPVTMTDSTAGATIYYTIDGSMPTINSTVYSGPVNISKTETLSAIGAASGLASSAKTTATYTIDPTSCSAGASQ